MYSEIVKEPQFYFDNNGQFFAEATTFIITSKSNNIEELNYLITLLNSDIIAKCFKLFYAGGGLGSSGYRYKKQFLENLCLPKITNYTQINNGNKNSDNKIANLLGLNDNEINYLKQI